MLLETLQQFPASWFHGTKSLDIDLTGGHQAAPLFLPFDQALAHLMLTRHGQLRRALLKALFASGSIQRFGTELFNFGFTPQSR